MMAWMAMIEFFQDEKSDPVKEAVLNFLASYGGLAMGVTFLISAMKALWKTFIKGKEPIVCIALSYITGTVAKLVTPVYGPDTFKAWALHLLILAFVAVGAAAFHDSFVNAITGKKKGSVT